MPQPQPCPRCSLGLPEALAESWHLLPLRFGDSIVPGKVRSKFRLPWQKCGGIQHVVAWASFPSCLLQIHPGSFCLTVFARCWSRQDILLCASLGNSCLPPFYQCGCILCLQGPFKVARAPPPAHPASWCKQPKGILGFQGPSSCSDGLGSISAAQSILPFSSISPPTHLSHAK